MIVCLENRVADRFANMNLFIASIRSIKQHTEWLTYYPQMSADADKIHHTNWRIKSSRTMKANQQLQNSTINGTTKANGADHMTGPSTTKRNQLKSQPNSKSQLKAGKNEYQPKNQSTTS